MLGVCSMCESKFFFRRLWVKTCVPVAFYCLYNLTRNGQIEINFPFFPNRMKRDAYLPYARSYNNILSLLLWLSLTLVHVRGEGEERGDERGVWKNIIRSVITIMTGSYAYNGLQFTTELVSATREFSPQAQVGQM